LKGAGEGRGELKGGDEGRGGGEGGGREVVVVRSVKKGSEAATKGVLSGDIVLSIAGEEVQMSQHALAQAEAGAQAQHSSEGGGMFQPDSAQSGEWAPTVASV
jgi:C-terminal processing protease CtpA/Prc